MGVFLTQSFLQIFIPALLCEGFPWQTCLELRMSLIAPALLLGPVQWVQHPTITSSCGDNKLQGASCGPFPLKTFPKYLF